eukprot:scaffold7638_cov131-Isochrysis_galbana.AAC.7
MTPGHLHPLLLRSPNSWPPPARACVRKASAVFLASCFRSSPSASTRATSVSLNDSTNSSVSTFCVVSSRYTPGTRT